MPYNTTAIPPRKEPTGQTQLPLSRVKKIISQDPEIHMCSNNAAFVITLAAEMFIQHLAEESQTEAKLERKPRRNIQYKDVANAISHHDHLEFLEDVAPKTVPFKKAKALAFTAQARIRGDKTVENNDLPSTAADADGDSNSSIAKPVIMNGQGAPFSVPLHIDERHRHDDPNDQLELEMRQAATPRRDGDVHMTG